MSDTSGGGGRGGLTKLLDNTTAMVLSRLIQIIGVPLGLAAMMWVGSTVIDSKTQLSTLNAKLGPNPDLALRDERIQNLENVQQAQGKQLDRIEVIAQEASTQAASAAMAAAAMARRK